LIEPVEQIGTKKKREGIIMLVNRPPMGWNTWNTFGSEISDPLIRESADAFVESGLKEAGYQYVVIDDCWSQKLRDPQTDQLLADPVKFPQGMKKRTEIRHVFLRRPTDLRGLSGLLRS
jgi:alpha-galactosidase